MGARVPVPRLWRYALAFALSLLTLAALGAAPGRALASPTQTSILMDDDQLIYASTAHIKQVMQQIAALGVNTVKVSMVWALVAPNASSTHRPKFNATDPNAYPPGAWERYDLVVKLAQQLNLGVYFQLTAPAPNWAVAPGRVPPGGHGWSHEPDAQAFGQFAEAVGRRYSGSFVPPTSRSGSAALPVSLPPTVFNLGNPLSSGTAPATPGALPRVQWWGVWNEPNEVAWLSPQTRRFDHRTVAYAPAFDRRLTGAGYRGLVAAGHGGDTILIGETASGGQTQPLPFLRALYCVGAGYRPLRGNAAAALECPRSGRASTFVAQNPALFRSAGFAHHPYSFDQPPNITFRSNPGIIMLANLASFERGIDRVFRTYGQPTGFPLYLTEWGYKTNPPNPFVHTSLSQQALWLNQGEYMAWRDPRVRALAQFLLVDDTPRQGATPGTLAYWSTFQTGLYYADGKPKPSFAAFRIPIWVPVAHTGPAVTVWGELRPAAHAGAQSAAIEYRTSSAADWIGLTTVQTSNPEGYLLAHVDISQPGQIRLGWDDPATGSVDYSRTVTIR